jgi:pyruvate/2-oxoglutarate dehydrogenase complex dihydrolipoamide acyltransferase (E2) component
MHVILLVLGIVVAVGGAAMLAFGISNNGFDIGNVMINAGTTAVVGGLIIIGLAAVARELRAARMPATVAPVRPAVAPAPPAPVPAPLEPPPRAPAGDVSDLSRVLAEASVNAPPTQASASPPANDPFAPARADPQRRAPPRERGFDAVWAPDRREPQTPPPRPEPAKAAPPPLRPAPEPAKAAAPPPSAPQPAVESEAVPIRPTREPQAVTVLKSGVIEGMAYTLYSDGSIEADLPQGMVRFASIDALRRHLAGQR